MRKQLIIGNWKMNKSITEVIDFFSELNNKKIVLKNNLIYGIAVPFVNIAIANNLKSEITKDLMIASQDISQYDKGPYTGEISAEMLSSLNVKYTIIGHSERRMYHNETNDIVNKKAKKALENKITPIICVGETLEEYNEGKSQDVVEKQIKESLKGIKAPKVVIAYEPIWAIGTGKTATIEYAQKMCSFIRSIVAFETIIQYGGSVNSENIDKLLSQPDIDGALVGGASLDATEFAKLISKK